MPRSLQLLPIESVVLNAINRFSVADLQTLRVEKAHKPPFTYATPDEEKLDRTQVTCFAANFRRGSLEASINMEQRRTKDLQHWVKGLEWKRSADLASARNKKAGGLEVRCWVVLGQSRLWRAPVQVVLGRICENFHLGLSEGALQLFRGYRVVGQQNGWRRKDSAKKWREIKEEEQAEENCKHGWTMVRSRRSWRKRW